MRQLNLRYCQRCVAALLVTMLGCADSGSGSTSADAQDARADIPATTDTTLGPDTTLEPDVDTLEPDIDTLEPDTQTTDTADTAKDDTDAADTAGDVPDGLECLSASDCDGFITEDKVGPCRRRACVDNACLLIADNQGQACDDDDVCTTADICSAGVCRGAPTLECDDHQSCTTDSCDPQLGCVWTPVDGGLCDDGDLCTDLDTCLSGVCQGTPRDCNALDNPCTSGVCDEATGVCQITILTGTGCDDHTACTSGDLCLASGVCSGTLIACADDDGCTTNWCDSDVGCRQVDKCDDNDPCTTDSCDATTLACSYVELGAGAPCDDGFDCSENDSCHAGICSGTPMICDDGLVCEAGGCVDELVLIPGGTFWMGCNEAVDFACAEHEKPQHEVLLDPFFIQRFEVTEMQYQACVQAGKCSPNPNITGNFCSLNQPDKEIGNWRLHPASCLTIYQAQTYCSEMLPGGRLPTEAEWEKAARGGCELYPEGACALSTPRYPWGNDPFTCEHGIFLPGSCPGLGLWPVGSRPKGNSPYGLHDMAGNVGEWVSDWYGEDYYLTSPAANPTGPLSGVWQVQKGGRYNSFEGYFLRASLRIKSGAAANGYGFGFRCVQPAPPGTVE